MTFIQLIHIIELTFVAYIAVDILRYMKRLEKNIFDSPIKTVNTRKKRFHSDYQKFVDFLNTEYYGYSFVKHSNYDNENNVNINGYVTHVGDAVINLLIDLHRDGKCLENSKRHIIFFDGQDMKWGNSYHSSCFFRNDLFMKIDDFMFYKPIKIIDKK